MSKSHFETLGLRAMGDRLALQAFCAPIQSTSFDEKIERLREALGSKGKRPGDPERTTSEHAPRLKKAPKETLKIEFGWKHHLGGKYVQIRKNKGGGNRTVELMRNAQYDECLKKAQELFFPDMSSQYGIYADMEARLANYNAEPIDDNHFSVGNYRKATGMNLPRVYLMTKAAKIKDRAFQGVQQTLHAGRHGSRTGNEVLVVDQGLGPLQIPSELPDNFMQDDNFEEHSSADTDARIPVTDGERIISRVSWCSKQLSAMEEPPLSGPHVVGVVFPSKFVQSTTSRTFKPSAVVKDLYIWLGSFVKVP
ncbi:uncharacterized protein LOC144665305 isoform X2 [Oculina patagonica]